ncbi:D-mannose binding lectin [Rathayibacter oskolensis]|uniref:D-mannose binding lectin n=1 Tax=Rathayibacter oskolensis TaxID=1891671 RepID=A0A1X7ND27_9MICO|nr:hypothetical protein [Rathayibacter oskolensis]SMH35561.1 D-mannose binding lectin [Rathayibacter oskolensis]
MTLLPSARSVASGAVALLATSALLLGATPALAEESSPGPLSYSHDAPAAQATSDSPAVAEAEAQRAAETYYNALAPGEELAGGESIVSTNGAYTFVMQTDGNAVTYDLSGRATWSTGTQGRGDHLAMQTDGNVVIYSGEDRPVWSTGTDDDPEAVLTIQDDGNLVVYRADGSPAWASSVGRTIAPPAVRKLEPGQTLTAGKQLTSNDAVHRAVMQRDGNFVVYGPGGAVWSSKTSGEGNRLVMQSDGNAVIYRANGSAAWSSRTGGSIGGILELQDNGNLIVFWGDAHISWSSRSELRFDTLYSPDSLYAGEQLTSADGSWRAVMQADGNFVVYGSRGPTWSTGTGGLPTQPDSWSPTFSLDERGTLSTASASFWIASPRYFVNDGPAVAPFRLVMQNDGNLVEYDGRGRAAWASRGL